MQDAEDEPVVRGDAPPHRAGPWPGLGSGARAWLVRHAEVHADWSGRAYGDLDVPLSAAGEARSEELAASLAALAPDRVLCSPLVRARHTGDALARRLGREIQVEPGLREVHRARWQGLGVAELFETHADDVRAFYADPWTYRGHGGEGDADVRARAWPAFEAALAGVGDGTLVVVAHYNVLRVVAGVLLGLDPVRSFAWRLDTGRASLFEDAPGGVVLACHNVHDPGAWRAAPEQMGRVPGDLP